MHGIYNKMWNMLTRKSVIDFCIYLLSADQKTLYVPVCVCSHLSMTYVPTYDVAICYDVTTKHRVSCNALAKFCKKIIL